MVEHHAPQLQIQIQSLPLDDGDLRKSRIMANLKDSILSQLDPSSRTPSVFNTHHSSHIHRRLQQLFHSFDTPTHPPYALMIRRAVTELNDGSGSTEEAISEFVRREYQDLPWAHVKILGFHLKKLCEAGELACTKAGRYMLRLHSGEKDTQQQCKEGNTKRSRRTKRIGNSGDGERKGVMESVEIREHGADETDRVMTSTQEKGERQEASECDRGSIGSVEEQTQSEKGWLQVVEKLSQLTEAEAEAQAPVPNELQESRIQKVSSIVYAQGSPECIISTDPGVVELSSPTQFQPQISSQIDLGLVSKTTAALTCVIVRDDGDDDDKLPQNHYKQGNLDENPMSGTGCLELEHKLPKRPRGRPRKSVANYQEESLLHIIHDKEGLTTNNTKKQHGPTRGRGRPRKVIQDTEQSGGEQLRQKDQAKQSGRGRSRGRPPKLNLITNQ